MTGIITLKVLCFVTVGRNRAAPWNWLSLEESSVDHASVMLVQEMSAFVMPVLDQLPE
jgi:hypothetical protein